VEYVLNKALAWSPIKTSKDLLSTFKTKANLSQELCYELDSVINVRAKELFEEAEETQRRLKLDIPNTDRISKKRKSIPAFAANLAFNHVHNNSLVLIDMPIASSSRVLNDLTERSTLNSKKDGIYYINSGATRLDLILRIRSMIKCDADDNYDLSSLTSNAKNFYHKTIKPVCQCLTKCFNDDRARFLSKWGDFSPSRFNDKCKVLKKGNQKCT
jgi:hypothetical protein